MRRKWNKLIAGAICVSLALPGSIVYAGEPGSGRDYGSGLEGQSEGTEDTGAFDLAAENRDDVEIFDAVQEREEVEAAEDTVDGVTDAVAEEDESELFSSSDNEEDIFTDGNPDEPFSDDEPVLAAGESVPIDEEHFPDNNFRDYLLDWENTFGNEDGILDAEEIDQITELSSSDFNLNGSDEYNGTADYTGIEYLTALEKLDAYSSNSGAPFLLDLSKNMRLKELNVSSSSMVSFFLNVSKNNALQELSIGLPYEYDYETKRNKYLENQNIVFGQTLTSLEKLAMSGIVSDYFDVSTFPGIHEIEIKTCFINKIRISECKVLSMCNLQYIEGLNSMEFGVLPELEELGIDEMPDLTEVSLLEVPCLDTLHINYTGLEKLTLPSCPKLRYLTLRENRLKNLDLRTCSNLENVDVSFNELTTLDITGLSKLESIVCLLNNLKEVKGDKNKLVGYPAGQREAQVKLYGNILYTSQIWGDEKIWLAKITNYRGLTPKGEDPGYGVDAAMCPYFIVDSFDGNSTEVSFDLHLVSMIIPVKLHLTKAQNTVINVPQKLIVSDAWDSGIELYWNHVTGADGYYVYRKINDSAYKKVATVKGGHINSYTDRVSAWGKYSYRIKAYGKVNGKTATSKYSKVNSCVKDYQWKPKLTAKSGSKSAVLTWKKLNGATGYQIYRATSKKGKYTKVATIKKGTTVKYTDSKLQAKKTYYYKIRPYLTVSKKNTYGSFSGIVNVKTK